MVLEAATRLGIHSPWAACPPQPRSHLVRRRSLGLVLGRLMTQISPRHRFPFCLWILTFLSRTCVSHDAFILRHFPAYGHLRMTAINFMEQMYHGCRAEHRGYHVDHRYGEQERGYRAGEPDSTPVSTPQRFGR